MDRIIVIGGKGTAINIAEQIDHGRSEFGSPQELEGFAIDDPDLGMSIAGFPVVCTTREVAARCQDDPQLKAIFALYKPQCMAERVQLLASFGIPRGSFASFVHPLSYVAPSARVGVGTVVLANSAIHHGAHVGDFCVVNSNVVVEHGASLGDNCFLAASACVGAQAELGRGVFVGLSASVRENTRIGEYAFIGMGSVVTRSVGDGQLAYGNPAVEHSKSW